MGTGCRLRMQIIRHLLIVIGPKEGRMDQFEDVLPGKAPLG